MAPASAAQLIHSGTAMNQPPLPHAGSSVPSPCVGVCCLDDTAGWCTGCLRTRDEITDWGKLCDRDKQVIWKRLTQRRRELPVRPPLPDT